MHCQLSFFLFCFCQFVFVAFRCIASVRCELLQSCLIGGDRKAIRYQRFRHVTHSREKLLNFIMSVRPSACLTVRMSAFIRAASTVWIFMKFDTGDL
jgi:hypothetical protein